jgi:YHS domain-containing protein
MKQPGAKMGERTYCPVSGVAFKLTDASIHRDYDGKPVYFCCEGCAGYFDVNREKVAKLRGLNAAR